MNEEMLFEEALSLAPEYRPAFLDRACEGRPGLRAAVEALLAAHEKSGNILDAPPIDPALTVATGPRPARDAATADHTPGPDVAFHQAIRTADYRPDVDPGLVIAGRYILQQKIGAGGMGDVWVAKQTEPVKRRVALKLIKTGMDSRALLQRFEQERQALAMMDHPNIAKVFDAGLTPTGQPFFVMELVNGLPLNQFCDEARLTTRGRLELFVPICQAVQHAHQKGIVHRDLKPANILVTLIDGKPVPKVIDFGVAKATAGRLTDESMSTQFGAVIGTLEYMSPEQAGFSGEDIDTRADIYSLGVILYELLTGLRPIDAQRLKKAALTEMIRIIREEEPSKPSTRLSTDESLPSMAAMRQTDPRRLMAILRGDLDWVVMKCLEKHRDRRYETANALARDVQRYLNGDAVEACPPSVGYRMSNFLKRNKGKVLAASLVLLALVAGLIGTAWGYFRADRARQAEAVQGKIAVEETKKAEEQRTRAETREEQAIDAVKKFRDAVANNPELKNNPALESLRKTLLKEPLAFFKALRDRLQADNDTRPESLARLAVAAHELADLTDEIGDKRDAIRAYRESLAIRERLARDHPTISEFSKKVADTQNNLGILLRETGDLPGARNAFEQARGILERLAREHPTVAGCALTLAAAHGNLSSSKTGVTVV
jgi:serine/threonine protein kinase